ncbi:MAG: hypothetical protein RLZZ271_1244, partial [Pseudomonadota bacterium]
MFVDSHCHLSYPGLVERLPDVLSAMRDAQVTQALCVCTTLEEFDRVHGLAQQHRHLWASVGVHPDNEDIEEPSVERLVALAASERVVAIGETGLDYYDMEGRKGGRTLADMEWQRQRFRVHIRAAQQVRKPLIIHTRTASDDTLAIMQQ